MSCSGYRRRLFREADRPLGLAVGDLATAQGEAHVVATAGAKARRQQRPLHIRHLECEAASIS
eukprot:6894485-Alexandrium_andersonii.AAC.1